MIKLSEKTYKNLLNSLCNTKNLYDSKQLTPTNLRNDLNNIFQGCSISINLHDLVQSLKNNSYKSKNQYLLSDFIGSNLLYRIWDAISDLNLEDNRDKYLLLNLELHKLWMIVAKQSTKSMQEKYTNTVDGLTFNHIFHQYTKDIELMSYEAKYYWKNVRKYSWNKLCLSPDKTHIAYVDERNIDGQVIRSHDLPNKEN